MNARWWRLVPLLGTAAVFWLIHGELLFAPTTPASYDLTGHLPPVNDLIVRLLPQGRVHGWSAQWFTGFPVFYFYFPLPALIVAALTPALGVPVSFKLTAALGVLAFPSAVYILFRSLPVTRAQAAAGSVVGATFLLMQSFVFLGGNIGSTLAGEYANSISFTLSLLYLAAVLRARDSIRAAAIPGALLACVALSHTVPTLMIVLVSAGLLHDPERRRPIIGSWILGFLLSGFWSIPFVLRSGEIAAVYSVAVRAWREALPMELWLLLPFALVGALTIRRDRRVLPMILLAAAGMLGFLIAGRLVYPGRFLPFWFLGIHLLVGYAVSWYMVDARERDTPTRTAHTIVAGIVTVVVALNFVRGVDSLHDWAGATFAGIERTTTWPEVAAVMEHLQGGNGRVYWEQAPRELAALGSRNLPAATPWFTGGRPVVNGLWRESSQLDDASNEIDEAFEEIARGDSQHSETALQTALARLREIGVTHVVALRPNTARALAGAADVHIESGTQRLAVFRIPGDPLIVSESADASIRVIEWSDERIRFETDAIGVPHIVRMSWFPNWRITGAAELERTEMSFMRLVPTGTSVDLVFEKTWVERIGVAASLVGAVITLLLVFPATPVNRLGARRP